VISLGLNPEPDDDPLEEQAEILTEISGIPWSSDDVTMWSGIFKDAFAVDDGDD
jgi:hypothetical protein